MAGGGTGAAIKVAVRQEGLSGFFVENKVDQTTIS
jgi:hypothetical protein